eukprot:UN07542
MLFAQFLFATSLGQITCHNAFVIFLTILLFDQSYLGII